MSEADYESAGAVGIDLPASAYVGALACLPGIGPAGLAGLLSRHDPATAWALVVAGEERRPETSSTGRRTPWAVAAHRFDLVERWSALVRAGIGVTYLGAPDYPVALREDPQAPAALFWRGDLAALGRRCVAIVGTRRCTDYGREIAFELGRDLAEAGVCVVSGLALGIDGAAHLGALAAAGAAGPAGAGTAAGAGPVGVAASGVDVPYPQRHTSLWQRVVAAGAILSETAPGQPAQAWRFPARNRIIAGLAGAVVVVESRAGGGSMLTVAAALARGLPVLAVPGAVHSPASEGTIQLLAEGSQPVRHAGDVLDALGDIRPWPPAAGPGRGGAGARRPSADGGGGGGSAGGGGGGGGGGGASRPRLDGPSRRILAAVDWTPTPTGLIATRTGVPIGSLSAGLHHLEALGLIRDDRGWWARIRRR